MQPRSFLHPNHAYSIHKSKKNYAPNIFVVPPEEDHSPPWCCFDATQHIDDQLLQDNNNDNNNNNNANNINNNSQPPSYFRRSAPGLEILQLRKPTSSETRSIVDALGDAHDYSDHENDQIPTDTDLEDDDEDDGIESEIYLHRLQHHSQYGPPEFIESSRTCSQEVGNDSDVIEVVKVRRHSPFIDHTPTNTLEVGPNVKASFRSRATQAFRSLRRTIRSTSKSSTKSRESKESLSRQISTQLDSKSSSKLRKSRSQTKPRAQDVFSQVENKQLPGRSTTPVLSRRSSSRISQLFMPVLNRRASSASFTSPPSPTEPSRKQEPISHSSSSPPLSCGSSVVTPSRRSSVSTQTRRESIYQGSGDTPTPTRNSYQRQPNEDEPTPSWHAPVAYKQADCHRSASPKPIPRSLSPTPSSRQPGKRFSVLSLHKIFHKSSSNINAEPSPYPPNPMPNASPVTSTCPSLSSTSTSEGSRCTTPTLDSCPCTPTSLDETEGRNNTVSTTSSSTLGSGVSLDAGICSGTVTESNVVMTTRTSSSHHPSSRSSISTLGSGRASHRDSLFFDGTVSQSRTSTASVPSVISASVTGSSEFAGDCGGETLEIVPAHEHNLNLQLDLDLDQGLSINLAPSPSGGLLSSNNMPGSETTSTHSHPPSVRHQGGVSRSLSLKSLSSKLGLGGGGKHQVKVPVSPVPALPPSLVEEGDVSLEMRLDSLHFDDLSFDAGRFVEQ